MGSSPAAGTNLLPSPGKRLRQQHRAASDACSRGQLGRAAVRPTRLGRPSRCRQPLRGNRGFLSNMPYAVRRPWLPWPVGRACATDRDRPSAGWSMEGHMRGSRRGDLASARRSRRVRRCDALTETLVDPRLADEAAHDGHHHGPCPFAGRRRKAASNIETAAASSAKSAAAPTDGATRISCCHVPKRFAARVLQQAVEEGLAGSRSKLIPAHTGTMAARGSDRRTGGLFSRSASKRGFWRIMPLRAIREVASEALAAGRGDSGVLHAGTDRPPIAP